MIHGNSDLFKNTLEADDDIVYVYNFKPGSIPVIASVRILLKNKMEMPVGLFPTGIPKGENN